MNEMEDNTNVTYMENKDTSIHADLSGLDLSSDHSDLWLDDNLPRSPTYIQRTYIDIHSVRWRSLQISYQ